MTLVIRDRSTVFSFLYEGYGPTVLEPITLGTAVITSKISSLAKIAGDAAYLVDPYDVPAVANGFRVMDVDTDLRKNIEEIGLLQAPLFSEEAYRKK